MDLKLVEEGNGGDLVKNNTDIAVILGFQNMPYLAMFGGNTEGSTPTNRVAGEQAFDWWGNSLLMANDQAIQFNSLTEKTVKEVPLTSSGRVLIEQAIKKDLEFMQQFAQVLVETSITSTDKILISIRIQQPDNLQVKEFIFIWDTSRQELTNETE